MIASLLRTLGIRRRNVVELCHKDTIDRLNRQLISARLRVDKLADERNFWMKVYGDASRELRILKTKVHTLRDPITGRYKRKEG